MSFLRCYRQSKAELVKVIGRDEVSYIVKLDAVM
jgi:hypothetical protein